MDLFNAQETLAVTVRDLATKEGKIRDRLFEVHGYLLSVPDRVYPKELQPDIKWIRETLTGKHGSFKKIRIKKLVEIAERILYLYDEINHIMTCRED